MEAGGTELTDVDPKQLAAQKADLRAAQKEHDKFMKVPGRSV